MTNDKLRIRITSQHPQAIVGEVLSMPEDWRNKSTLISHGGMEIASTDGPAAFYDAVHVWGTYRNLDSRPFARAFDTTADCNAWLAKVRAAVRALNATIESKLKAEKPLSDAEIEAMKWTAGERAASVETGDVSFTCSGEGNACVAVDAHNSRIDRLHAEIKRLRKEAVRGS